MNTECLSYESHAADAWTWRHFLRDRVISCLLHRNSLLVISLILVISVWGLSPVQVAHADSYIVNSLADNTTDDPLCTLREAILTANNASVNANCGSDSSADDVISFSVSGSITLTASLPGIASGVGKLTIDASGRSVTISGNNTYQVFYVNAGATLDLNGLTIVQGYSPNYGGGLRNDGTATVTYCTFSDNRTDLGGAGIYNWGAISVTNSTFSNNAGAFMGGGVATTGLFAEIDNSTFFGNNATWGGGVANGGNQSTVIVNSTFFSNSAATNNGGGIYSGSGVVALYDTLVANSTGGNCGGIIYDGGNNLSWGDTTCPGINADPKLGVLAENGGSTQTLKLGHDSAAIDAGDNVRCATIDQRGMARNDLRCDIGAYELKYADSHTVIEPVSSAAVTTFGPALMGLMRDAGYMDPGVITVTKNAWKTQGIESIGATWAITPSVTSGFSLTMQLCYTLTELGSLAESDLRFWRYDSGAWMQVGSVPALSTVNGSRCATLSGIDALSTWALATAVPTEVALNNFRAVSSTNLSSFLVSVLLVVCLGACGKRLTQPKQPNSLS